MTITVLRERCVEDMRVRWISKPPPDPAMWLIAAPVEEDRWFVIGDAQLAPGFEGLFDEFVDSTVGDAEFRDALERLQVVLGLPWGEMTFPGIEEQLHALADAPQSVLDELQRTSVDELREFRRWAGERLSGVPALLELVADHRARAWEGPCLVS